MDIGVDHRIHGMDAEQELLLKLYKTAKSGKEATRYHAILLVKAGSTLAQVARLFYVDEDTVRSWVAKWEQGQSTKDRQKPGRPALLTRDQQEELCNLIDENDPSKHNYQAATWDCVELKIYALERFGVTISPEAIRRMLKRKGFSYVKAEYLFTRRDEGKRRQFIDEIFSFYEALEQGSVRDTILMYTDQMSTKLHPKLPYVWTRNGKPLVPTNCSHKRLNTIAAIEPTIGTKVCATYEKNNADSFVDFLSRLEREIGKNIVLVLDNYPVHHSKKVREFLETSGKIALKFLPTYSPDFNPIEWLWGYARKKRLNGLSSLTVQSLRDRTTQVFDSITPEIIRRICSIDILRKHRIT
jgi:transposase